jgi:hypothetical protein
MGRIADRIGVRWTVVFGAVMIGVGLAISSFGAPWQLYVGHGLFIGFLGNGGFYLRMTVERDCSAQREFISPPSAARRQRGR